MEEQEIAIFENGIWCFASELEAVGMSDRAHVLKTIEVDAALVGSERDQAIATALLEVKA